MCAISLDVTCVQLQGKCIFRCLNYEKMDLASLPQHFAENIFKNRAAVIVGVTETIGNNTMFHLIYTLLLDI